MKKKLTRLAVLGFSAALTAGSLRAQTTQTWINLGEGRGLYDWIYLVSGVAVRSNQDVYLRTYNEVAARGPSAGIAAPQAAAGAVRIDAERRLTDALTSLREHDPKFFDQVMQEHGVALLK